MNRFFLITLIIPFVSKNASSQSLFPSTGFTENMEESHDSSDKMIIGGVPTEPGRYPYIVRLVNNGVHACAGTLVAPDWVLTTPRKGCQAATHVEIGRYNTTDPNETYQEIEISIKALHPEYHEWQLTNALMLVQLKEASNFSTVTLNNGAADLSGGTNVTILGWGRTSVSGNMSDVLREIETTIVEHEECSASHDNTLNPVFEDSMICTNSDDKDACTGDGGGPVLIKGGDITADVQIGMPSWNVKCADPQYPLVNALVHTSIDFIESITSCSYDVGTDITTFENCCSVTCTDGVFSCLKEDCSECGSLGFKNDGFDYSLCNAPDAECRVGDGICDNFLFNNPECNFDGGDCCKDTCTIWWNCDTDLPYCIDPDSSFKDGLTIFLQKNFGASVNEFLLDDLPDITFLLDLYERIQPFFG